MGMAASQARLLSITARIHDVEYKAQSIQNAKIALATQNDQVYQEYLEALDSTTLTVKDCQGNLLTANFNNLCGMNPVDTGLTSYAFLSSTGALIVPDDIADAYNHFKTEGGCGNWVPDAYGFALYCIFGANAFEEYSSYQDAEDKIYQQHCDKNASSIQAGNDSLANLKARMDDILKDYDNNYTELVERSEESENTTAQQALSDYKKLEDQFKSMLYNKYAEDIYNEFWNQSNPATVPPSFDDSRFNFYVDKFKQIEAAGGCVSISSYDGDLGGDAANDGDWLQNMIKCGKISMVTYEKKSAFGGLELKTTSPETDQRISYTTTSTIDKKALAKAQAKYEHDTKEIDQKDKKFDMDLKKLETERTALTTEYNSVKKVITDNIERTFGIFS